MIRSAITISLVPEARGGPFVFWDDLAEGCRKAKALGFDAVEIFPPDAASAGHEIIQPLLNAHGLKLAALGTGAGWVKHRLTLTAGDAMIRSKAREFIRQIVDAAGKLGAPAIIGSMQGRWADDVDHNTAMSYLREALEDLGNHAKQYGVPLLYEPLNRYETNLVNQQADGVAMLKSLRTSNVKLLCDLFHMAIEEPNIADTLRASGEFVRHVHFADSNRRPIGGGHTDVASIVKALNDIGYAGYMSAECFPYPDCDAAAERTMRSFHKFFANS